MKNIYRNPIFYYILVPLIAALWPLSVGTVYLPGARENWRLEKAQYNKAQEIIDEILAIDPDRLKFANSKTGTSEFDYADAVEKIASLCGIPPANYKLNSGIIITSGDQKSQSASVVLRQVDITKFARFLSTIQFRWPNLQCVQMKLTQKKGLTDVWDADLKFKYYY